MKGTVILIATKVITPTPCPTNIPSIVVNIIVFHNKRKVSDENNQTNCYFFSN